MPRIRLGERSIDLPASRIVRIAIGVLLILLGLVGFLPVVGFWMIPLGLLVLSVDLPMVRRWRRRLTVRFGRWLHRRHPALWHRLNGRRFEPRGKGTQKG